jgi:predicted NAD/FAD-binding protein/cyclopropane fatty-acyl-phospholipid synthase-like methyltransferase
MDSPQLPRVAIVGCGVGGLGAAYALGRAGFHVTLFESRPTLGGHANTVEVAGRPIDTGFLVFNEDTYPNLLGLFEELGVPSEPSDMSFSVSLAARSFEWSSDGLSGLLAQPGNALSPEFRSMLSDMMRFNKEAPEFLAAMEEEGEGGPLASRTLGEFLDAGGFGAPFRRRYLLPQVAAVWSASGAEALAFPARTLLRFMVNHSLLQATERPVWRTVSRRSREYVRRLAASLPPERATIRVGVPVERVVRSGGAVTVTLRGGEAATFDGVVFGCHPDEALALLGGGAAPAEAAALGGFRYATNAAYLHTDESLMPARRGCWTSWNYVGKGAAGGGAEGVEAGEPCCVTYWLNRLQNLPPDVPNLFVTLNPAAPPAAERTLRTFEYAHPQYSAASVAAQAALGAQQGKDRVWWAGAYLGYGFHEDGLTSGLRAGVAAAEALAPGRAAGAAATPPWWRAPLFPTPVEGALTKAVLAGHGAAAPAAEVDLARRSGGPFWVDNLGNGGPVGLATLRVESLLEAQRAALWRAHAAASDTVGGAGAGAGAVAPDALRGTTAVGDIEGFLLQSPDDVLHTYKLLIGAEGGEGGAEGASAASAARGGADVCAALLQRLGGASPEVRCAGGRVTPAVVASLCGRRALADPRAATALLAELSRAAGAEAREEDARIAAAEGRAGARALARALASLPPATPFRRLLLPVGELMAATRGGYTGQHPPLRPPAAGGFLSGLLRGAYGAALRAGAAPVCRFLADSIRFGALLLRTPDGEERVFGDPSAEAPLRARLRVHSWSFFFRVATESDLGLARSFMAGEWSTDDLTALFNVFIANRDRAAGLSTYGLWTAWVGLTVNFLTYATRMDNSVANSQSNIHAHYDLSNDLFTAFLDPRTMMYSCGFFDAARRFTRDVDLSAASSAPGAPARLSLAQGVNASLNAVPVPAAPTSGPPGERNAALRAAARSVAAAVPRPLSDAQPPAPSAPDQLRVEVLFRGSLEAAQLRKLDHLIARAGVQRGDRVLDLGFGWGGLSIRLAETVGCRVHGITLSQEQHDLALKRVRARGLQHLITYEIVDYRVFARDHPGEFDKIISVEMIEAVGHNYFPSYMAALDRLLAPQGVIVIQAITMPEARYPEYLRTCDFINTIIFPGGAWLRNGATRAAAQHSCSPRPPPPTTPLTHPPTRVRPPHPRAQAAAPPLPRSPTP